MSADSVTRAITVLFEAHGYSVDVIDTCPVRLKVGVNDAALVAARHYPKGADEHDVLQTLCGDDFITWAADIGAPYLEDYDAHDLAEELAAAADDTSALPEDAAALIKRSCERLEDGVRGECEMLAERVQKALEAMRMAGIPESVWDFRTAGYRILVSGWDDGSDFDHDDDVRTAYADLMAYDREDLMHGDLLARLMEPAVSDPSDDEEDWQEIASVCLGVSGTPERELKRVRNDAVSMLLGDAGLSRRQRKAAADSTGSRVASLQAASAPVASPLCGYLQNAVLARADSEGDLQWCDLFLNSEPHGAGLRVQQYGGEDVAASCSDGDHVVPRAIKHFQARLSDLAQQGWVQVETNRMSKYNPEGYRRHLLAYITHWAPAMIAAAERDAGGNELLFVEAAVGGGADPDREAAVTGTLVAVCAEGFGVRRYSVDGHYTDYGEDLFAATTQASALGAELAILPAHVDEAAGKAKAAIEAARAGREARWRAAAAQCARQHGAAQLFG